LFALASALVVGCKGDDDSAAKTKEAPRVTVVHPIVRSLVDEDEFNGWLEAFKTVDVVARVRGYITKVDFKDGEVVTEDKTPLFEIDDAPYKADLAKTKAQAAAFQAQEVAAVALAARNKKLLESNAVSVQEWQESDAKAKSYAAQIDATNAEAARIQLDIDYCKIFAPLSGRVGKANLVKGALVNPAGPEQVLTTIVSITPMYVDFNVDERSVQRYQQAEAEAGKLKPLRERNTKIKFALDTDQGFPREATLVFADIKFATGTGTALVRAEAKNENGLLVPGSRVRVRVPVSEKYDAVLVPDTAVNTDQKQKYLLVVVGDDKKVKRVDVELGRLLDNGMRVIKSPPLKTDAQIISEGMERARLNYPVEPILEKPASPTAVASVN
jgi:multidrug efflux system membrane fusion protein